MIDRKRMSRINGCALLITGLVLFWRLTSPPTFQGRNAAYWLEHWDDEPKQSDLAFKMMGRKAVPYLVRLLKQKPSKLGATVDQMRANPRMEISGRLGNFLPSAGRTVDRRKTAAFLLSQMGPEAEAAIPTLIQIIEDPAEDHNVVSEAFDALLATREKLVLYLPRFISYLNHDDPDMRETGVALVRSTGPKAKAVAPLILKLFHAGRVQPFSAARALWSIDQQTNLAVRVFTDGLQS